MRSRFAPRRALSALVFAVALMVGVTGCGDDGSGSEGVGDGRSGSSEHDQESADALRKQVAAADQVLPDLLKRFEDIFQDIDISAEGDNTLVYTYTYLTKKVADEKQPALKASEASLKAQSEVIIETLETSGVNNPLVRWIYLYPDGSEVGSFEFGG